MANARRSQLSLSRKKERRRTLRPVSFLFPFRSSSWHKNVGVRRGYEAAGVGIIGRVESANGAGGCDVQRAVDNGSAWDGRAANVENQHLEGIAGRRRVIV